MTAGRPTLYESSFCERVVEMGRKGYSKAMMAENLDVARNTLDNWAKENPEFLSALTRAMDYAQAWFEHKAVNEMENPTGLNAGLYGRVMAARFPEDYRETTKHDLVSSDRSMSPEPMSLDELYGKLPDAESGS